MHALPVHPTLNAALNGLSTLLLLLGFIAIKANKREVHRFFMVSAFLSSTAFLVSYLAYHFTQLVTPFSGQGPVRTVYFVLLISHIVLAVVVVPLVLITLRRAAKGDFESHRAIARITFPVWFYVSLTGVMVYWMLYIAYPAAA